MKPKAAFLMTHPTQYHAPWFRALAARPEISIHVYYGFQPGAEMQGTDFGVGFEWDVPLLEGYSSTFLKNVARNPGWGYRNIDTPELRELIQRRHYSTWVINGWTTKSEWLAIRTCWRSGTPMMVRGDSTLIDRRSLGTRILKRAVLGRWIPRFTRYLTVGKLNEQYYEHYGGQRERFVPVRHFVDNDWFASRAKVERDRRHELRGQWGIDADALVFLFVGKFIDKKRPLDSIRAMARLSRGRKAHLLMVGDGELKEACRSMALELKVPVSFAGFLNQSRMPEAYAAGDVLVLPSAFQETWGLVVNEAMASGLPAIVSDKVGCAPDLVIADVTGRTIPSGNVAALAEAMEQYVRTPGEESRQGLQAAAHIRDYSLDAATENTVRAIVDVSSR